MPEREGSSAAVLDHPTPPPSSGVENLLNMPKLQVGPETVKGSLEESPMKKEVEAPKLFPVEEKKNDVVSGARTHSVFLVEGETGSGKSSFVPGYVLEAMMLDDPEARVIVTQPRRIAVEETYNRVKSIVGEDKVAFYHGKGKAGPPNAKITIMPDASLTNLIKRNPTLKGIRSVIVDEAHEEGTNMIANMGLLKKIQRERAGTPEPLQITYTTATFDKDKHKRYNPEAGDIHVEGRTFPVVSKYIDNPDMISDNPEEAAEINKRIFEGIRKRKDGGIEYEDVPVIAARITNEILKYRKDGGDPVVILPGKAEIDQAVSEFKRLNPTQEYAILMGGQQDAAAFKKIHHEEGRRIVFFASEVVEASVTIDKATDVIDCGFSRKPYFDLKTGLTLLKTVPEAKANNRQRVGRAGRTRPGRSITLVPQAEMEARPEHLPSELHRADLTSMVLILKSHGFENIEEFDFIEKPNTETLNAALQKLYVLGALDSEGKITQDIGEEMARIPLEPHLARMMVEAKKLGCGEDMEVLMGFMSSTKQVFKRPEKGERFTDKYRKFVVEGSDILTFANVWNDFVAQGKDKAKQERWARENYINLEGMYDVQSIKNELSGKDEPDKAGEVEETPPDKPIDIAAKKEALTTSLISGLTDRVLVRKGTVYSLIGDRKDGIIISDTSVVGNEPYVVSGNIRIIEKIGKTYAGLNEVVPKDVYDKALEKITNIPSGILVDKKEEQSAPLTKEDEKAAVAAAEEITRPLTEEDDAAAVEEAEKVLEEKKKEDSFLHTVTTPIRWVGEDVQALVNGVWKSVRWLLTGK